MTEPTTDYRVWLEVIVLDAHCDIAASLDDDWAKYLSRLPDPEEEA